jgi:hypothetical protein
LCSQPESRFDRAIARPFDGFTRRSRGIFRNAGQTSHTYGFLGPGKLVQEAVNIRAAIAGNQPPAEQRNPHCYDNEITGQGQLERSEGEIETEIWPINR